MANKSTFRREAEIHVAAWFFAHRTRDAKQIGAELQVSDRTVRRYSEDPLWDALMDEWNYTGPRNFRINRAGRKRKG